MLRLSGRCRNSSSSRFRARHSGASAALQLASVRCGRRRLGSRAFGRLWRYIAPRTTFRQDRALSQATGRDIGGLPRSHLRRLLPPLADVAFTPLRHLRAEHFRSFENGKDRHLPVDDNYFPQQWSMEHRKEKGTAVSHGGDVREQIELLDPVT